MAFLYIWISSLILGWMLSQQIVLKDSWNGYSKITYVVGRNYGTHTRAKTKSIVCKHVIYDSANSQ